MVCVFCSTDRDESVVRKDDIKWYVCGSCTQRLVVATEESLLKAYALAVEKGMETKATALQSFIYTEDEINEREARNKQSNYRKRTVRTVRNDKRRPWETAGKRRTPVSENRQNEETVS